MKAERTEPYHVDPVRRVESGHVLVLESHDLEELVGEMADMQAEGWRLVGWTCWRAEGYDSPGVEDHYGPVRSVLLVRGVPGAPVGVEVFSEEE